MTKFIATILFFVASTFATQAQITEKDFIGKWKLETVASQGKSYTAQEAFGSSDIYQNYVDAKKFEGIVNGVTTASEWKLNTEKKEIVITHQGTETIFKIIEKKDSKMTIELESGGMKMQLNYAKLL